MPSINPLITNHTGTNDTDVLKSVNRLRDINPFPVMNWCHWHQKVSGQMSLVWVRFDALMLDDTAVICGAPEGGPPTSLCLSLSRTRTHTLVQIKVV